ncbi:MAG: hypothetical protein CMD70_07495 [Gammaproteobacteria bacterium]|jgi:hypothetical protein|nr:hypothetical protein [Gammaproteobacteria bacterium]|tara:strand:- start:297 stop:932 length:636 start_codon:yes stop_codon:yes gene_type:complete
MRKMLCILTAGFIALVGAEASLAQGMSFFITSVGSGNGGDLGGLEGADAHCQNLAESAGAGDRTWRAYLGTQEEGRRGIDARSRIGTGPWYNAAGILIATNLDDLHLNNNLVRNTSLDENGDRVNGRGDSPNRHDTLTGAMADGTAFFAGQPDRTCSNWTSSDEGQAMVGHFDRQGGGNTSWNAAHPSRSCSQSDLEATGGDGLYMCFAAD